MLDSRTRGCEKMYAFRHLARPDIDTGLPGAFPSESRDGTTRAGAYIAAILSCPDRGNGDSTPGMMPREPARGAGRSCENHRSTLAGVSGSQIVR
ncbi:uncharacterized protein TRAVEDRAFT_51408 [Trametes versicolor FP-101664 SS1]|uniref:uncharacterized protein n=1 Tax=Trametes versicolor (strain FP-101664) TaxID=717944 RepID=UPI00046238B8|nr:uncharacterized protein TRAVEDRAFT_51408 [Trametes versicolor FP-101664 SS1]EIW55282.1 hypothetical protein TRAVEDRAFT_51408 [Trametes versicolor FP-101664 SS1]